MNTRLFKFKATKATNNNNFVPAIKYSGDKKFNGPKIAVLSRFCENRSSILFETF